MAIVKSIITNNQEKNHKHIQKKEALRSITEERAIQKRTELLLQYWRRAN